MELSKKAVDAKTEQTESQKEMSPLQNNQKVMAASIPEGRNFVLMKWMENQVCQRQRSFLGMNRNQPNVIRQKIPESRKSSTHKGKSLGFIGNFAE